MSVRHLSVVAWLDADAAHVWIAHDCLEGRVEHMLPRPEWEAGKGANGELVARPSYHCRRCDCHTGAEIPLLPLGQNGHAQRVSQE